MNCYTDDPDEIYNAIMTAPCDDIETIGSAVAALARIVGRLEAENKKIKAELAAIKLSK